MRDFHEDSTTDGEQSTEKVSASADDFLSVFDRDFVCAETQIRKEIVRSERQFDEDLYRVCLLSPLPPISSFYLDDTADKQLFAKTHDLLSRIDELKLRIEVEGSHLNKLLLVGMKTEVTRVANQLAQKEGFIIAGDAAGNAGDAAGNENDSVTIHRAESVASNPELARKLDVIVVAINLEEVQVAALELLPYSECRIIYLSMKETLSLSDFKKASDDGSGKPTFLWTYSDESRPEEVNVETKNKRLLVQLIESQFGVEAMTRYIRHVRSMYPARKALVKKSLKNLSTFVAEQRDKLVREWPHLDPTLLPREVLLEAARAFCERISSVIEGKAHVSSVDSPVRLSVAEEHLAVCEIIKQGQDRLNTKHGNENRPAEDNLELDDSDCVRVEISSLKYSSTFGPFLFDVDFEEKYLPGNQLSRMREEGARLLLGVSGDDKYYESGRRPAKSSRSKNATAGFLLPYKLDDNYKEAVQQLDSFTSSSNRHNKEKKAMAENAASVCLSIIFGEVFKYYRLRDYFIMHDEIPRHIWYMNSRKEQNLPAGTALLSASRDLRERFIKLYRDFISELRDQSEKELRYILKRVSHSWGCIWRKGITSLKPRSRFLGKIDTKDQELGYIDHFNLCLETKRKEMVEAFESFFQESVSPLLGGATSRLFKVMYRHICQSMTSGNDESDMLLAFLEEDEQISIFQQLRHMEHFLEVHRKLDQRMA